MLHNNIKSHTHPKQQRQQQQQNNRSKLLSLQVQYYFFNQQTTLIPPPPPTTAATTHFFFSLKTVVFLSQQVQVSRATSNWPEMRSRSVLSEVAEGNSVASQKPCKLDSSARLAALQFSPASIDPRSRGDNLKQQLTYWAGIILFLSLLLSTLSKVI